MRKYKYRAMSGNGKIVSGELDAADYKDACNKLRAASSRIGRKGGFIGSVRYCESLGARRFKNKSRRGKDLACIL